MRNKNQNAAYLYGAVVLLLITSMIAGFMIAHYYEYGQWQMDDAMQSIARQIRLPWLDGIFKAITATGETLPVIIITLLIVTMLAYFKKYKEAAIFAVHMLAAWRLNDFLKELIHRPRPAVSMHLIDISHHGMNSLPSGHSMNFMALVVLAVYFIWFYSKNVKWSMRITVLALFYGILVGLSRVYLNVHYFSDVIIGWSIGIALAAISVILHRLLSGYKIREI